MRLEDGTGDFIRAMQLREKSVGPQSHNAKSGMRVYLQKNNYGVVLQAYDPCNRLIIPTFSGSSSCIRLDFSFVISTGPE